VLLAILAAARGRGRRGVLGELRDAVADRGRMFPANLKILRKPSGNW
jgi:hypothetical protein